MTTEIFEPSYTIQEFCYAERISKPKYYELKHAGLGPREMRHSGTIRISHQARLEWQRQREQLPEAQRKTDETVCPRPCKCG